MATKSGAVDPSKFPDEVFDLYSIPAFDRGEPEVVPGKQIGSAKQIVEPGDVLLSKIVPHIRRTWVVGANRGRRIIASGEWIVFRDDRLHPRYMRHVLVGDPFHAQFMSTVSGVGGSLLRARPAHVANITVPLPPLPEQRRIAEVLDRAEALRAKRRAALAQLDTLTQSIFLDMFGDPATNPMGWPLRRLDSICGLVNGRAFKPEEWDENGVPIIRIQNLNDASKPFNYTTQVIPERFRVRPRDILFSWSGTPGTSFGCFRWNGPEGWLNQHIFNVKLNGTLDGDFFIAHMNLKLMELIAKAHGGVGLQHVTKGMVDETMLMIPPESQQAEFARRIRAVSSLVATQNAAYAGADALFVSLQHRAFSGGLVSAARGQLTV